METFKSFPQETRNFVLEQYPSRKTGSQKSGLPFQVQVVKSSKKGKLTSSQFVQTRSDVQPPQSLNLNKDETGLRLLQSENECLCKSGTQSPTDASIILKQTRKKSASQQTQTFSRFQNEKPQGNLTVTSFDSRFGLKPPPNRMQRTLTIQEKIKRHTQATLYQSRSSAPSPVWKKVICRAKIAPGIEVDNLNAILAFSTAQFQKQASSQSTVQSVRQSYIQNQTDGSSQTKSQSRWSSSVVSRRKKNFSPPEKLSYKYENRSAIQNMLPFTRSPQGETDMLFEKMKLSQTLNRSKYSLEAGVKTLKHSKRAVSSCSDKIKFLSSQNSSTLPFSNSITQKPRAPILEQRFDAVKVPGALANDQENAQKRQQGDTSSAKEHEIISKTFKQVSANLKSVLNNPLSIYSVTKNNLTTKKIKPVTYLDRLEQRIQHQQTQFIERIQRDFQRKVMEEKKQNNAQIDADSYNCIDVQQICDEQIDLKWLHQQSMRQWLKEKRKENATNKMNISLKKLRDDTADYLYALDDLNVGDYESDDASQHQDETKEIQVDNIIYDRILEEADKNLGQTEEYFNREDSPYKHGRTKKLAEVLLASESKKQEAAITEVARVYKKKISDGLTKMEKEKRLMQQETSQQILDDQESPTRATLKLLNEEQKKHFILKILKSSYEKFTSSDLEALTTIHKALGVTKDRHVEALGMDCRKNEKMLQKVIEIVKQLQYKEIGRLINTEVARSIFSKEPLMVYQAKMNQFTETALPLINKVIDGKLILQEYTLDIGHCSAFVASIKQTMKPQINALLLDNCGIDDGELFELFDGLLVMNNFEKFVLKRNEFMENSLQGIKPILTRPSFQCLQELRLVNCVTTPKVMEELLDFMIIENVRLRTVSLVQMGINSRNIEQVSKYLQQSQYLEDLDLSWNDLIPLNFTFLFKVIQRNKTLRSLNLSCNTIIDKSDQNKELKFTFQSLYDQYVQQRIESIEQGKGVIYRGKKEKEMDHPEFVLNCLNNFIRRNKCLQTLNLNNTGLNSQILVGLVQVGLRHAKSLVCLHMDSNPGSNDQIENFYRERLKIKPEKEHLIIDINPDSANKLPNEEQKSQDQIGLWNRMQFESDWKIKEVDKFIENRRLKPLLNRQEVQLTSLGRPMTLTRMLGHQNDIPGSGQWKILNQEREGCWACDNWMYTILFWNEDIGEINNIHQINLNDQKKSEVVNFIRKHNPNTYKDNKTAPVLFSSATNWEPLPLINMVDFLNTLGCQEDPPNFDDQIMSEAKEELGIKNLEKIRAEVRAKLDAFMVKRKVELYKKWKQERIVKGVDLIQSKLRYKKPQFINKKLVLQGNHQEMWLFPFFSKPRKVDFMIRSAQNDQTLCKIKRWGRANIPLQPSQTADDIEFKFYYQRNVINIREERIPNFNKIVAQATGTVTFKRSISVFKDWQEDTENILLNAFKHDTTHWKIPKMIDNESDLREISDFLQKNYDLVKEIYVSLVGQSIQPPDLKREDMFNFCQKAGILDKNINYSILSIYFTSTNYEYDENGNNSGRKLNRYEFIEILIRLAKGKYIDFGKMKSLPQAVQKLFNEHVFPMFPQFPKLFDMQKFRDNHLWSTEVSDLLEVNIRGIYRAYEYLASVKKFNKTYNLVEFSVTQYPSVDQIHTVLTPLFPDVQSRKIVQAIYQSRSTCVDEVGTAYQTYTFVKWPEFLEFLGRLAQLKYEGQRMHGEQSLSKKLESVLDVLLALVNEQRLDPAELTECISETDDDY